jgi:hypothetical protein
MVLSDICFDFIVIIDHDRLQLYYLSLMIFDRITIDNMHLKLNFRLKWLNINKSFVHFQLIKETSKFEPSVFPISYEILSLR